MEFFRIHKTIPFLKYRHILNGISLVSFLIAVYWIFTHGLAFSIEFTGGTQMEVNFPQAANTEQVRTDLKEISNEVLVQNFGTARDPARGNGRRDSAPRQESRNARRQASWNARRACCAGPRWS